MPGDNFSVSVRSLGWEHFQTTIRLAWANAPGGRATHYVSPLPEGKCLICAGGKCWAWKDKQSTEYPCPGCRGTGGIPAKSAMILLWNDDYVRGIKSHLLPFPLTAEAGAQFLWDWLKGVEFEEEPDQRWH